MYPDPWTDWRQSSEQDNTVLDYSNGEGTRLF